MTDKTILEPGRALARRVGMTNLSHFRCFKTSPEIIRAAVMMYEPLLCNRYGAIRKFPSALSGLLRGLLTLFVDKSAP